MSTSATSEFLMMGVSHQSAPVAVRELCSVPQSEVVERLRQLEERAAVREAWLLSTCNRTEALVAADDAQAAALELQNDLFARVAEHPASMTQFNGIDAVFHLFRVVSGLESQVLGESEIQGQFKRAIDLAREAGTCGRRLEALLRHAINVGKRVRDETRLGEGTLSVARAAVDFAKKVYGHFDRVTAIVVGAGDTGQLVATHLRSLGVGRLRFCNRTTARAETAAREHDGDVLPMSELREGIATANLVIVSVEASEPVIREEHLDQTRLRRHDRPVTFIDLSVPRGVAAEVREQPMLLVHDVDDLESIVASHRIERQNEVESAGRIVVSEVHKYLSLSNYDALKPLVKDMGPLFEDVRQRTLDELPADLDRDTFGRKLTRRLLDALFTQLKMQTRRKHTEDEVDVEYRRFMERR